MTPIRITLPDEAATNAYAQRLAPLLQRGDVIFLSGEIGAGKSHFARALIRARLGDTTEVPSPTFTLVQTYDDGETEIWHCDLYRLTHPDEVMELGLDVAFGNAICLIEWPDRLGASAPEGALRLHFRADDSGHSVTIEGEPPLVRRLGLADV